MKCRLDECNEQVFYKKAKLCLRCYNYIYSYGRKGPTATAQRLDKVRLYAARLMVAMPANVRVLRKRA